MASLGPEHKARLVAAGAAEKMRTIWTDNKRDGADCARAQSTRSTMERLAVPCVHARRVGSTRF